jgi:heme oxygenase
LIARLRAETAALHQQLDDALELEPSQITRQKYVEFLRGSLAALEPLEAQLRPDVSRCELLRRDLATLGVEAAVPALADPPLLSSEAAVFGARYVIEGSALGGAILSRSFDNALGLNGTALSYLTLHGAALGAHWRAFLAEIEGFGQQATPEMRAEACESAKAVFKLYARGFRSSGAIAAP